MSSFPESIPCRLFLDRLPMESEMESKMRLALANVLTLAKNSGMLGKGEYHSVLQEIGDVAASGLSHLMIA